MPHAARPLRSWLIFEVRQKMKCPYCVSPISEMGGSTLRCERCGIVWSSPHGRLEEADVMRSSRWLWSLPAVSAFVLLISAIRDSSSVTTALAMLATGLFMLLIAWCHGVVFLRSGLESQAESPVWFWFGIIVYGLIVVAGAASLLSVYR